MLVNVLLCAYIMNVFTDKLDAMTSYDLFKVYQNGAMLTVCPEYRITTKSCTKTMKGQQPLGNVYNVPHMLVTGEVMEFQREQCHDQNNNIVPQVASPTIKK